MEKLVHNFVEKIAVSQNYDDEKKSVIKYGLVAMVQMFLIFAIVSFVGLIFGFWLECIIIFLAVGLLRKSTGGAHAKTIGSCLVQSILIILVFAALSHLVMFLPNSFFISIFLFLTLFIISALIIYRLAPVDSPNKPIVSKEKIARLRKNSFITLLVYFILAIIFLLFSLKYILFLPLVVSIGMASFWQSLTLLKTVKALMEKLECILMFNKKA